jgi:hypothetical protein
MEFCRFPAELLDVATSGVRLQQSVIDHVGHTAWRPARGMHAETGRARVEHAAQAIRTAVEQHRVAGAASGQPAPGLRLQDLFGDDLDEALKVLGIHERSSRRRILARRLM